MFGKSLPETESNHGTGQMIFSFRIDGKSSYEFREGFRSVVIIRIDHRKGSVGQSLPGRPHCMSGSPGPFPTLGQGKPCRQVELVLISIGHLDDSLVLAPHLLLEGGTHFFADQKDHPGKTRPLGVEDGIIHQGLPGRPDGFHLLEPAVAGTETSGEHQKRVVGGFRSHCPRSRISNRVVRWQRRIPGPAGG